MEREAALSGAMTWMMSVQPNRPTTRFEDLPIAEILVIRGTKDQAVSFVSGSGHGTSTPLLRLPVTYHAGYCNR